MSKKIDKKLIILAALIVGGSLLFLLAGYYGSLALYPYLFSDAAEQSTYYNLLTPIIMIACFFIYEGVIFLVYILKIGRKQRSFLNELTEDVELEEYETEEETSEQSSDDSEQKKEVELSEEKKEDGQSEEVDKTIEEDEVIFDESIFLPLYDDYSMDQLKAMMRIGKYMDHVNADMLRQMFKKDMSAEEISNYITMYYS